MKVVTLLLTENGNAVTTLVWKFRLAYQSSTTRLLVLLLLLEEAFASKGCDKLPMIAAIPAYVSKVLVGIAALHVQQQYLAYAGMFPRKMTWFS